MLMIKKIFKPVSGPLADNEAEAEVRGLLRELELAHVMSDAAALDELFSEDFVYYDYTGRALSRDECLSAIREGAVSYDSWDSDEIRVRSYADTAIITSLETISAEEDGRQVKGKFRLTLVLVKEIDSWRIVLGHETQLAGAATE